MTTDTYVQVEPVDLDDLAEHPRNVRRDVGDVAELAASIGQQGVLQPLVVALNPDDDTKFVIVAGHRRATAARLAGEVVVPCLIRADLDTEAKIVEAMLVENLHRSDLTPIEEADAYQRLTLFDYTPAQIAERVGRSESTVRRRLHLAELDEPARDALHAGQLTLVQADRLAELVDVDDAAEAVVEAVAKGHTEVEYELKRHEQRRERRDRIDAVLAEAARRGFEVFRGVHPDGWVQSGRWFHADSATPANLPDGPTDDHAAVWDERGTYVTFLRRAAAPSATQTSTPADESEERASAERIAAQRKLEEDIVAASHVRDEWLTKVLNARRPKADVVEELLRQAVTVRLDDYVYDGVWKLLGIEFDMSDEMTAATQIASWSTPRLTQVLWALSVWQVVEAEYQLEHAAEGGYFAQLSALGYEPVAIERDYIAAAADDGEDEP